MYFLNNKKNGAERDYLYAKLNCRQIFDTFIQLNITNQ